MSLTINEIIILFFVYSIIGWLMEIFYRSIKYKKLYNPGVLTGPYVPLYGFAGILILHICSLIQGEIILSKILVYFFLITVIEFITGELLLLFFNKRYWDYTDNRFNYRGHICLRFSIIWVIIAMIFELTALPLSLKLLKIIPTYKILFFSYSIVMILSLDFIITTGLFSKFITNLNFIINYYINNSNNRLNFNNIQTAVNQIQIQSQKITKFMISENKRFNNFQQKHNEKINDIISEITLKVGMILKLIRNKF